ncbi:hypothetical protein GCM10011391_37310 [Pullulanibacillus camelliae]|uniref:Teichoic acid biosynthesis protein n=1 Tax=Pullulanibacillus camelliae TaxID=1707096 RepID=A0A8J3E0M7_9BACL|nr:DUF6270 domain-containing protein [Pullulanibacillus camelliae]GGE54859.1 hypothetical protein GCM10011391_37310 [Pullulanibacillus camelliae]
MGFEIEHIDFNIEKGKLLIHGETFDDNPSFILRKRQSGRDFEFKSEIKLDIIRISRSKYTIEIDLNLLLLQKNYLDETIWNIFMVSGLNEHKVQISESFSVEDMKYFLDENYILKIKPYVTQDHSLAFFLKRLDINFYTHKIIYENGILNLRLKIDGLEKQVLSDKEIFMEIKKRSQKDLPFHDEIIKINSIELLNESFIDIVVNISDRIYLRNNEIEQIWDFYILVRDGAANEVIYPIETKNLEYNFKYYPIKSNLFYRAIPYVTGNNRIALYVSSSIKSIIVTKVVESAHNIMFYISPKFKSVSDNWELVLKKQVKMGSGFEYFNAQLIPCEKRSDDFSFILEKSSLTNLPLRNNETWDLFIRFKNNEMQYIDSLITVTPEFKDDFSNFVFYNENNNYKLRLIQNKKRLSLIIDEYNCLEKDAIKIAVLGTCFSRNAFNSSNYFNPDYKRLFNCVFTQFHSSLISLVSDSVNLDLNIMNDIKSSDLNFLKIDFDKTFFEHLKRANADYFIIDLYPDASKSVLKFGDNQYVTGNYILEESKSVSKLSVEQIIDHSNNEEYFDIWKNAARKFAKRLREIFPEENIILNKGRFTPVYYDENRKVKTFGDPDLIKRNNYFWEKLDDYFTYLLPNIKTIDLTDCGFIGDINYPFGLSYSHYESGYYKEYLNRLTKLILQDRLF